MTRSDSLRRIAEVGVVPVVRLDRARLAAPAVDALLAGGIPVVEITLTVPDAIAVIRELAASFRDRVLVGAGTVTSSDEVRVAVEAGARFIVSPGFDPEIVRAAHALDVPAIPGVLTPSEIMRATREGAEWLKIFPSSAVGGPKYLRALRGPFPQLRALPTGGVSLANVAEYIAAGAVAVGVGSELVDVAELEAGAFAQLRERALAFATTVRRARSNSDPSYITENQGHDPAAVTRNTREE